VTAVAQRLILALPAPTELDQRASVEIKLPAVLIKEFKITFNVNTPVAFHHNPGWHFESPFPCGRCMLQIF
jgi:hypothetical protein